MISYMWNLRDVYIKLDLLISVKCRMFNLYDGQEINAPSSLVSPPVANANIS